MAIRGGGSGLQFSNYPYVDTTYTKVFVGGLAWETKSETLHNYFHKFGEILEAVVITDKQTGRSKGYGFVTFRDPEAAKKACADPSPVIDGRKANCNLASLGRPPPPPPLAYGRMRSLLPHFGSLQIFRGTNSGIPSYHQPVSFSYQSKFSYPPYGYSAYGPEYMYPQGFCSSYMGQHQPQMYNVPGSVNTNAYSYGQLAHPGGSLAYRPIQGFLMPGSHPVQYGRTNFSGPTAETIPAIQAPFSSGMQPFFGRPRSLTPALLPRFPQSNRSDLTAG